MFKKLVTLLVVLLLAPAVAAQTCEISGPVTDPQGLVLSGADLRLYAASAAGSVLARPLQRVLTDMSGEFRMTGVAPGQYRLLALASGFERRVEPVTIVAAGLRLDLRLKLAGVHEGIVVTATRSDGESFAAPVATTVTSEENLRRQAASNVAQALEDVPGVQWVNAGAFRSRPLIRGLDSNRILVLVDGERLNNARTSTSEVGIETSLIDLAQLEQVEVVRGPGSVLYGSDAFGGVINLRTKSPAVQDGFRLTGRLRGELFTNGDTWRSMLDLSAGTRGFGVRVSGSLGAAEDYFSPRGQVFRTGVDESSAQGELRYYPQRYRSFFVKFLHKGAYHFGFPDVVAQPEFLGLFPYSKLQKFGAGYQANYNSSVFSSVHLRFYYQKQARDFVSSIRLPFAQLVSDTASDVATYGIDFQATSLAAQKHVLTYGLTHYRDRIADLRTQSFDFGPFQQLLSRAPSVPHSTLAGSGFFLQDQFELTRRLRFSGGVRFDRFHLHAEPTANYSPLVFGEIQESRRNHAITGNAGAAFEIMTGWVITGQVGRAFREPNLFERYFYGRGPFGGFVVPNPDLTPETSLQFDAGTRFQRGIARLTLNYFHNQLKGLLLRIPGTFQGQPTLAGEPVYVTVNLARSRIQGIESTAELQFTRARAQWTPFVTMSWQRGSSLSQNEPLPFIAPFTAHAGLRWQPAQLRVWSEWRTRIAKGGDRVPPGYLPLSGFAAHSFRAGYESSRGEKGIGALLPRGLAAVNLHLGIENLGNRHYRNLFESVPQPGRSFRFGLDFQFDSATRK
jgi:hemoglobin/transferrin/lactoferrin receptor protein